MLGIRPAQVACRRTSRAAADNPGKPATVAGCIGARGSAVGRDIGFVACVGVLAPLKRMDRRRTAQMAAGAGHS